MLSDEQLVKKTRI